MRRAAAWRAAGLARAAGARWGVGAAEAASEAAVGCGARGAVGAAWRPSAFAGAPGGAPTRGIFRGAVLSGVGSKQEKEAADAWYASRFLTPTAPPTLAWPPGLAAPPEEWNKPGPTQELSREMLPDWKYWILYWGGYYSYTTSCARSARRLHELAVAPAARQCVAEGNPFGLRESFAHEYTMLALHAWVLHKRLRRVFGRPGQDLSQELHGFMNEDVEMRVYKMGVRLRASHWNKQMENQFYLLCTELDLAAGDKGAVVDVLRNRVYLFDVEMDDDDIGEAGVERLADYLEETHAALANTEEEALLSGEIRFRVPANGSGT